MFKQLTEEGLELKLDITWSHTLTCPHQGDRVWQEEAWDEGRCQDLRAPDKPADLTEMCDMQPGRPDTCKYCY